LGDTVGLVRSQSSDDITNSIYRVLDLIDFKIEKPVKKVAIKPNLCYYWDASTGYTTDPRVVSGIIDWVRDKCGEYTEIFVVEADASAMRTNLAFPILGYEKLAEEKNIKLYNLSDGPSTENKVSVNNREMTFKTPQLLQEADFFINVPKMKLMRISHITCGMKNIFGCISSPLKNVYHPFLNTAIVGINKVLEPHLTVVDGLVGLGRNPIKLDLIMASKDVFSIDWIASEIMGYNPSTLEFLRIAEKEGFGSHNGIKTVGNNPEEFKQIFPKVGNIPTEYLWSLEIGLLKLYSKIVNDIVPPFVEN
jgi:uncharacterized protein (DUF362 family)